MFNLLKRLGINHFIIWINFTHFTYGTHLISTILRNKFSIKCRLSRDTYTNSEWTVFALVWISVEHFFVLVIFRCCCGHSSVQILRDIFVVVLNCGCQPKLFVIDTRHLYTQLARIHFFGICFLFKNSECDRINDRVKPMTLD